jgi:hypothetical protein
LVDFAGKLKIERGRKKYTATDFVAVQKWKIKNYKGNEKIHCYKICSSANCKIR